MSPPKRLQMYWSF